MIRLTVELNPFLWSLFRLNIVTATPNEPNLFAFTVRILGITLLIMIDDGEFINDDDLASRLS